LADTELDINSPLTNEAVWLFPNPIHAQLRIQIPQELRPPFIFTITDQKGSCLYTEKIMFNNNLVKDTKLLPNGLYYVTIHNENGRYCMPFVKQ